MCGGLSAFSQVTGTNQTRLLSRWPDSWRSPCVGLLADGWSGFPTQLCAFYFTYTHSCTNAHIQISCQPQLNTCPLTREEIWLVRIFFLQAFRFNMQLERTSPCVHACVCLRVSGLSCTVWESIQLKTLYLAIHHSSLLSFLYLLLQSASQSPS